MELSAEETRAHLNAQTARIDWEDLQRHFAKGAVVRIAGDLDLIEVALDVVNDNKARMEELMASGQIGAASDEEAQDWYQSGADVWAVVVAPFVLVQARKADQE